MTTKMPLDEESEIKFSQRSWQIRILQIDDFKTPLFTVFYYPEDSRSLSGIVQVERRNEESNNFRWFQKLTTIAETSLQLAFIDLLGKAIDVKMIERSRKLQLMI